MVYYVNDPNESTLIFTDGDQKFTVEKQDDKMVLSIERRDDEFITVTEIERGQNEIFLKFYECVEELLGYDDPHYSVPVLKFKVAPIETGYRLSLDDAFIDFGQADVVAFKAFLELLQDFLDDFLKDDKKYKILTATHSYISEIANPDPEKGFDISTVIETMLYVLKMEDDIAVFAYPGGIPLWEETTKSEIKGFKSNGKLLSTVFKPVTKSRYNIGIFSVYGGGDHYLVFILDNKEKSAWLFDSLSTDAKMAKSGFSTLIETFYPKYSINGVSICSGCGKFEPLTRDLPLREYIDQNIFCHTWSLWFIYQIVSGLKRSRSIQNTITAINNSCKTPRENLMTIKHFALWLSENVLEVALPSDFQYIINPDHIIQSGSARDTYELLQGLDKAPAIV